MTARWSPTGRTGERPPRLAFGGDYNPEQWPEEVWAQDVQLMQDAGVTMVSVGIFSWALLEPRPGTYDFGWLDRVLDVMHEGGLEVDLATATASPPPWLARLHPETLPVTADGARMWPGGRQAFCPSSPVYRDLATGLARRMAERYRDHPALALWHVSNEIGCHNAHCYCDVSAEAFRSWLERRYGGIDRLNEAWGTRFWSQRYDRWDEVWPPRLAPTFANPTQQLDFARFSSDELLHNFTMERDVLREVAPDVPVTTNFMVMTATTGMDYFAWGPETDVISNDHYVFAEPGPGRIPPHVELSFCADWTRGVARGEPWMLMEHSTSAVNWQPRNVAKAPGELRRNSLQHVARGADAVLYFQWRAAQAGAEKFHSAMLPHAGADTKVFREAASLGALLGQLGDVAGSTVRAQVAMVLSWDARWATALDSHPSTDVTYLDRAQAHYYALWERGVTVDMVPPDADLSGYALVIVPTLYLVDDAAAAAIADYAEGGGTVLVTYFSGIVDPDDHIRLGGYPGAFRALLGVSTEEFYPLHAGERVQVSGDTGCSADVWTEHLHLDGAEAVQSYLDGPLPGVPAVTRHAYGQGTAWYVATRLDPAGVAALTARLLHETGVAAAAEAPPGVEVVRRHGGDGASWLFVLNHTDAEASVAASGIDVESGAAVTGRLNVPAGASVVVREGG